MFACIHIIYFTRVETSAVNYRISQYGKKNPGRRQANAGNYDLLQYGKNNPSMAAGQRGNHGLLQYGKLKLPGGGMPTPGNIDLHSI